MSLAMSDSLSLTFFGRSSRTCCGRLRVNEDGRWPLPRLHCEPLQNEPSPPFPLSLLEDAFAIATALDRTVYDALYVALAMRFKSQLITADEALANALAAHMPVKWLGSL
jgi:predicted nucleic acid-binding protein